MPSWGRRGRNDSRVASALFLVEPVNRRDRQPSGSTRIKKLPSVLGADPIGPAIHVSPMSNEVSGPETHVCDVCGESFESETELCRHVRNEGFLY